MESVSYRKSFYIAVAIIVVLLSLFIGKNNAYLDLQQTNNTITKSRDKMGREIVEQKQQVTNLKLALKQNLIEKEDWMKNIKSQVKIKQVTQIKEVFIPFHDTIERMVYVDSNSHDTSVYIKTPVRVSYADSFNYFGGRVLANGFALDSMGSLNKLRITITEKKQGLFKKPIPVVQVVSDNPKSEITDMQNVVIQEKKPFFQRYFFGVGLGAVLAILLI